MTRRRLTPKQRFSRATFTILGELTPEQCNQLIEEQKEIEVKYKQGTQIAVTFLGVEYSTRLGGRGVSLSTEPLGSIDLVRGMNHWVASSSDLGVTTVGLGATPQKALDDLERRFKGLHKLLGKALQV